MAALPAKTWGLGIIFIDLACDVEDERRSGGGEVYGAGVLVGNHFSSTAALRVSLLTRH